jgi:hypothetical protein
MKTYLITGSTRGLGLETVKELAKNKENRVIMAIRDLGKGWILLRISEAMYRPLSLIYRDYQTLRLLQINGTQKLMG